MADLSGKLGPIVGIADNKAKVDAYSALITEILGGKNVPQAKAIVNHLLEPEVPLVVSRQALHFFAIKLKDVDNENVLPIAEHSVQAIAPKVTSFEEEDAIIRDQLAEVLSAKGDFIGAAQVLTVINMEGSSKNYTSAEKCEKYVQIAELFLEGDDSVSAESYISKSSMIIFEVTDVVLQLRHRVCHTRVLDARRDFLSAARSYFTLS